MSTKFKPGEGDWICSDQKCGNVNFSRRTQCNKCGKDKSTGVEFKKGGSEIGKELAEKSKGLFSADDWQCKTCGNVNWARRSTCNICNAPKYGKIEPRTGLGGGYMERDEVVEYKERGNDDDEYDEFGRKKKKRVSSHSGQSSNYKDSTDDEHSRDRDEKKNDDDGNDKDDDDDDEEEDDDKGDASKYKLDSDEDDDEEDDDDEDADLSKYNLSDDEEIVSKKKDVIEKKPAAKESSSKRSRSRSRSPPQSKKKSRRSHSGSDSD